MFKDWIRRMVREAYHESHVSVAPPSMHSDLQSSSLASAVVYSIDNGYLLTIRVGSEHGHKSKLVYCAKIEDIGVELAKSSYLNRLQPPSMSKYPSTAGVGVGATYPGSPSSTPYAPMPTLISSNSP